MLALMTLVAPVSWGTTYVVVSEFIPGGNPLSVATLRVLPAGVVLCIYGYMKDRWIPQGSEWVRAAGLGLLHFGIFFPLLIVAVYRMPGGMAATVGGLQPLFVGGVSWLVSGRRPALRELAVGFAAAVGVALVVLKPGFDLDLIGLAAAIGANASFGIGIVLTKRLPAARSRVGATGWQMLLSGVLLVPIALVVDGPPVGLDGRAMVGLGYLSLIGTAMAFIFWFNGVQKLPVVAPPLLGLAAPLTGTAIGWIVLAESLDPSQMLGLAIVIGAISYGATRTDETASERLETVYASICSVSEPILTPRTRAS